MILIRQGKPSDLDVLLKLAKMVHFINLPADRDVILDKLRWSRQSFQSVRDGAPARSADDDAQYSTIGGAAGSSEQFVFIAEDVATGNIIGTSGLVAQMGGPGQPNVSLRLRRREFFSEDLQGGATHVTAKLVLDESGPTEIGGLIVGPSFRRHPKKVGKQLSLVRFHYIGLHRARFQDRVLAEMMAPLTPDGRNTFWEYFGRRFINLTYDEADRFCQKSREFMISLLPKEEIYLTLLPAEARALVGKVGDDTIPARRMLERLGFAYHDLIDPFDAGPHLEAATNDIELVRATRLIECGGAMEGEPDGVGFVSADRPPPGANEFRCIWTEYALQDGAIVIPEEGMATLGITKGDQVGFTPVGAAPTREQVAASEGSKGSKTS